MTQKEIFAAYNDGCLNAREAMEHLAGIATDRTEATCRYVLLWLDSPNYPNGAVECLALIEAG